MNHRFFCSIILLFTLGTVNAQVQSSLPCRVQLRFLSPLRNQLIAAGQGVDVEVKDVASSTLALSAIKHINLYLNGQFVARDSSFPYRWEASRHRQLRNLPVGKHQLKAEAIKKCDGRWISYYQGFEAGNSDEVRIGERLSICYRLDPMRELLWLKDLIRKNPKSKICEYRTPQRRFFRITYCNNYNAILWNDCSGKLICKINCATVRGVRFYKCWYNGCSF